MHQRLQRHRFSRALLELEYWFYNILLYSKQVQDNDEITLIGLTLLNKVCRILILPLCVLLGMLGKQMTQAMEQRSREPKYRYNPNDQYRRLVRCLSWGQLHKGSEYNFCFAERQKSDQSEALRLVLESCRKEYVADLRVPPERSQINVSMSYPWETTCLQACDYFLWALQKYYEDNQKRSLDYVWSKCLFLNDRSAHSQLGEQGTYFTRKDKDAFDALLAKRMPQQTLRFAGAFFIN